MYYTAAYATPTSTEQLLFPLGRFVATQGAITKVSLSRMLDCLRRHMQGDWGCVFEEDAEVNNKAVRTGERILSAYPIDETKPSKDFGENTFWIITEADCLPIPPDYGRAGNELKTRSMRECELSAHFLRKLLHVEFLETKL